MLLLIFKPPYIFYSCVAHLCNNIFALSFELFPSFSFFSTYFLNIQLNHLMAFLKKAIFYIFHLSSKLRLELLFFFFLLPFSLLFCLLLSFCHSFCHSANTFPVSTTPASMPGVENGVRIKPYVVHVLIDLTDKAVLSVI